MLQEILSFVNLCGSKTPFSDMMKAAYLTTLINTQRNKGAGSVFYSGAPDDVHDPNVVRWSAPFEGRGVWPAVVTDGFLDALQGTTGAERQSGGHDMREATLQANAIDNPVAATVFFLRKRLAFHNIVVGANSRRKKDVPTEANLKGAFGLCVADNDVVECNGRGTHHFHGIHNGGAHPTLVADVAHDDDLREAMMKALSTTVEHELPLIYHAVGQALRVLRIPYRRDAAFQIPLPHPPVCGDPATETQQAFSVRMTEWFTRFRHHAYVVAMNRNLHEHQFTCTKGKKGCTGCRMFAAWGHDVDESRCTQLHVKKAIADTEEDGGASIEFRCQRCYAGGALQPGAGLLPAEVRDRVNDEDRIRHLCYVCKLPQPRPVVREEDDLQALLDADKRTLAVEVKRRVLPLAEDRQVPMSDTCDCET